MFDTAFAQAAQTEAAAPQANPLLNLLPIFLIFFVFYFLLIRPQKKAQVEHAKMLAGLSKNDEVVTSGGMYGTIVNIQNDVVTLKIDDDTKVRVQKSAITTLKKTRSKSDEERKD